MAPKPITWPRLVVASKASKPKPPKYLGLGSWVPSPGWKIVAPTAIAMILHKTMMRPTFGDQLKVAGEATAKRWKAMDTSEVDSSSGQWHRLEPFRKKASNGHGQDVELVITTRHSTANDKLSKGQQSEKTSSRYQEHQIQNIQNMRIFAGRRNKPGHDEENPAKRSCA